MYKTFKWEKLPRGSKPFFRYFHRWQGSVHPISSHQNPTFDRNYFSLHKGNLYELSTWYLSIGLRLKTTNQPSFSQAVFSAIVTCEATNAAYTKHLSGMMMILEAHQVCSRRASCVIVFGSFRGLDRKFGMMSVSKVHQNGQCLPLEFL